MIDHCETVDWDSQSLVLVVISLNNLKGFFMYKSFSDTPADEDKFKIESYVTGLSKFIKKCDTPLTFAIQGDWGTGKTSIMRQIKKQLEEPKDRKVKTIFFNTWQYSQFDMGNDLAVSLISDLIKELSADDQKELLGKVAKNLFSKGLGYVKWDFGPINSEKITENIAAFLTERNENIKSLKEQLQSIIDNYVNRNKYERIVIFIDDLDRLIPERAVELLEVLKLFLDCENCVFVLAIDYSVVIRGVKMKYGESLEDEKGKAFFEKIIQVPFTVPVANYNLSNFIKDSLEHLYFSLDEEDSNNVIQLIRHSIGNNPRSINRLFNSVSLLMYINADKKKLQKKDKLLILATVCFQLRFEEAYDYILMAYNNSSDEDEIEDYLIDLLEESFNLPEKNEYDDLVKTYGKYTMESEQDRADFENFYQALKQLLNNRDDRLTDKNLRELLDKMTTTNLVSVGNADTVVKQKQNHAPNEDVQYVIRKLFNRLAGKEHFDLSKPKYFGKEENREAEVLEEFRKIPGEYDRIRLTRGKGQGINTYSSHDKANHFYTSGNAHGKMHNDGMMIFVGDKLIDKIGKFTKGNYPASELRKDEKKYKEFEDEFITNYFNLLDKVRDKFESK